MLAKVAAIFSRHGISVSHMVQEEESNEDGTLPIIFITHKTKEHNVNKAVTEINLNSEIVKVAAVVRVVS